MRWSCPLWGFACLRVLNCQLRASNAMERLKLEFHTLLAAGRLPYTIGGGIGQSRMCMYFCESAHRRSSISVWPEPMRKAANSTASLVIEIDATTQNVRRERASDIYKKPTKATSSAFLYVRILKILFLKKALAHCKGRRKNRQYSQ